MLLKILEHLPWAVSCVGPEPASRTLMGELAVLLWLFISGHGRVGCVPGLGSAEKGCLDMIRQGTSGREMLSLFAFF